MKAVVAAFNQEKALHTLNFLYEMWGQICACCSHEQNPTEHVQCTGLGWWESWQLTTVSANKSYVSTNDRLLVGACHQLDNWEWRFLKSVCWHIETDFPHNRVTFIVHSHSSRWKCILLLDNLKNGKFHKTIRDTFAPQVIRYVDLMESSIGQSIHKGFEREKWEIKG